MIQTIGNVEYNIGDLSAMDQLHLVRRLARGIPVMEPLVAERNEGKDMRMLTIMMLSNLSDEDYEYVLGKCFSVVSRKDTKGNFAKIMSPGGLMFDDINVSTMLEITAHTIVQNLGDFFRDALSSLAAGATKA